jgi:predicted RNase H-like HicB family nuclease
MEGDGMKYAFTAKFEPDEGAFMVTFPDLPGCITTGDTIEEAIDMAQDALCLFLYSKEEDKETIPLPTKPRDIRAEGEGFTSIIAVDTEDYRRYFEVKSVKKTLSIPAWLNSRAEAAHAPYSQILQQGLKDYLGIKDIPHRIPRA